ncbi:hypothetical protein ACWF99_11890 [Nocardia sp. NPDC055002]
MHYNAGLDNTDARDAALKAILAVQDIIAEIFPALGGPPRFVAGTSGHALISSDAEKQPLIRRFYLPSSVLVSPTFKMEFSRFSPDTLAVQVFDDETYHDSFPTLTDEEFAHHRTDPEHFQLATPASE